MATKVQLRGGTSEEHVGFIGLEREVTVDTTAKTLRVHDGQTPGGHPLALQRDLTEFENEVGETLQQFRDNISSSHNHDNTYSQLNHAHDLLYPKRPTSSSMGLFTKILNGYNGLFLERGNDEDYIRTTKNGILPYQSGGYSNIGSTTWRFAGGYFSSINSLSATLKDLYVSSSVISLGLKSRVSHDESTGNYDFISDNQINKSRIRTGSIELNGKRIYIGSSFPSDARVNDILIQI